MSGRCEAGQSSLLIFERFGGGGGGKEKLQIAGGGGGGAWLLGFIARGYCQKSRGFLHAERGASDAVAP